jgi:4-amino-4-deoxy-L-arabinose transferase-like glycosyltransferase
MAKAPKIRPPFAWLGQHTALVSLVSTIGIGAFFRFNILGSLPPGLDGTSATIGLQALHTIEHGNFPGLNISNDYAPLWIWLQITAIKIFGATALSLRIWPAVIGTLTILTTWLWMRSWFNLRMAWLTAFLLAVTPWAVTISRNGTEAVLWPFLVTLTLWLASVAWRKQNLITHIALAVALVVDLLCGPVGWLLTATTIIAGLLVLKRKKRLIKFDRSRTGALVVLAAGLGLLGYFIGLSADTLKNLPTNSGLTSDLGSLSMGLVKTILMFNVTGDQNYQHNLAGEPMLNAFVGLMLVAGILVGLSRLHERRYRFLFIFLLVTLVPSVVSLTGQPNAAHAAPAMPFILALAATGISYMLELWYQTFPINSAARLTGQLAIIVLLALSLFQGYTQYFRAWAGTSQVYAAYNEGAVQMAGYLKTEAPFKGQNVIVATPTEFPIVAYLDHNGPTYVNLTATGIKTLPQTGQAHQFIISASSRDEATKELKARFPGGILYPHYSTFNQAEIYYTYVVSK